MDNPTGLVIGADHDTIRAGHPNFAPEFEASFTVHIPLQDSGLVGYVVAFSRHLTMGDGLRGAVVGTLLTVLAEFFGPNGFIGIVTQGKISKYLAEPNPRTKFFCD
jgi:hypothetical protein